MGTTLFSYSFLIFWSKLKELDKFALDFFSHSFFDWEPYVGIACKYSFYFSFVLLIL